MGTRFWVFTLSVVLGSASSSSNRTEKPGQMDSGQLEGPTRGQIGSDPDCGNMTAKVCLAHDDGYLAFLLGGWVGVPHVTKN